MTSCGAEAALCWQQLQSLRSVLGAQAARTGDLEILGMLAILAYVGCVFATLYILLPHKLVLEFRGTVLLEAAREVNATADEVLETAAEWIESFHEANRDELARLGRWFSFAVVAVGIEIVLWTISLGNNLI